MWLVIREVLLSLKLEMKFIKMIKMLIFLKYVIFLNYVNYLMVFDGEM